MPKVGATVFPFTRDGIAAAKAEAKKTGLPITGKQTYADTARKQSARAKHGATAGKATAGGQAVADGHGQVQAPKFGVVHEKEGPGERGGDSRREELAEPTGQPKTVKKANK